MKKVALCIHDLRVSEAKQLISAIDHVIRTFNATKITIHLIADNEINIHEKSMRFLQEQVAKKQFEVVFHGISHQCSPGTGKWLYWYHHNQAEFLGDDFNAERNTTRYISLNNLLGTKTGICPPCWIAGKKGWRFLKHLSPPYLEKMIHIQHNGLKFLSPVISLGSDKKFDLFFLKIVAFMVLSITWISRQRAARLVVHVADLQIPASMNFFRKSYNTLLNKGYQPVLLKEINS